MKDKYVGSSTKTTRPLAWYWRLDGPLPPSETWRETSWTNWFEKLKDAAFSAEAAWWLARALMLQRGKSKLGFQEMERLTMTIIQIIDSSDILHDSVLPLPLLGPDKRWLYTVSLITD